MADLLGFQIGWTLIMWVVGLGIMGYGAFLSRFQQDPEKGIKFLLGGMAIWVILFLVTRF